MNDSSIRPIETFGLAVDAGAETLGAALGVWDLWYQHYQATHPTLHWNSILPLSTPLSRLNYAPALADICVQMNQRIQAYLKEHPRHPLCFISGDHSGALAFWGSMLSYHQGELGLLWIDAHMDSHTPKSSQSKNIHGMPLSHLLGQGEKALSRVFEGCELKPENTILFGVRSYEPQEKELLERLGVQVYYAEDIQGKETQMLKEVLDSLSQKVAHFGVSLDVDALDPSDAPGTGCRVLGGLNGTGVLVGLSGLLEYSSFVGLEVSEYNPIFDESTKTRRWVQSLLNAAFLQTPED